MEIYRNKLELLEKKGYCLLAADKLASMDTSFLKLFSDSWADALDKYGGENTFHPHPSVLLGLMQKSHASILTNNRGEFISGAKIQPWVRDENGYVVELNDINQLECGHLQIIAAEVGGIVTIPEEGGNGCGSVVAESITTSFIDWYQSPQVAVVRRKNINSAKIFYGLNWTELDESSQASLLGFDILDDNWRGSYVFCNPKSIGL